MKAGNGPLPKYADPEEKGKSVFGIYAWAQIHVYKTPRERVRVRKLLPQGENSR